MSEVTWAWTFDRAWCVAYTESREVIRMSKRELVECEDPHLLIASYQSAADLAREPQDP